MSTLLRNAPAEPAVLFAEEVEDLLSEARNFLDGEPITTEQQAEAVSSLLNRLRRVSKDADEARKVEAKPFDDGKASVQAKWKPIIEKGKLAASVAKQALAPWLVQIEKHNQAAAEAARVEAERMAQLAREAHQASAGDLTAKEDAERLLKAAKAAEKDAARLGKAKAHATGGERAVGLVDVFTPVLTDPLIAARHYWATKRPLLEDWLLDQAEADVRAGQREIPGFEIKHERVAR